MQGILAPTCQRHAVRKLNVRRVGVDFLDDRKGVAETIHSPWLPVDLNQIETWITMRFGELLSALLLCRTAREKSRGLHKTSVLFRFGYTEIPKHVCIFLHNFSGTLYNIHVYIYIYIII